MGCGQSIKAYASITLEYEARHRRRLRLDLDNGEEVFDNAFCEDLRCHSSANGIMGVEFIFEDMNFVERFFVKRIAKIKSSISDIDYKAINEFLKNL